MKRIQLLPGFALAVCLLALACETAMAQQQRAFLDQYCVTCHNDRTQSGNLNLQALDLGEISQNAETLEKVVRKVRAGMMPPTGPSGAGRPDQATMDGWVDWLESELDRVSEGNPHLVPPGLHRLNRTEYANAVRDLLALEIDAEVLLPVDDSSYGFDNMAGSLGVSPALLEAYVSAAGKISRLALGHELTPREDRFVAPQDYSQESHVEGLPFGTRGGLRISYFFPADGEYVISFAPVRGNTGELFGGNRQGEKLEVTVDGERVGMFDFDSNQLQRGTDEDRNEVRISVNAGQRTIGLAFMATTHIPIDDLNQHTVRSVLDTNPIPGYVFSPQVGSVIVTGPYDGERPFDTESRRKILTCSPATPAEEASCAEEILGNLAEKAFRRPGTDEDLETLLTFYDEGRQNGDFEVGIQYGVARILSDPEFIYRAELPPADVRPGEPYRISDLELASRLSFFLWSSIPDEELLALADEERLHEPAVLEAQVRRMLADPKSTQLVDNFTGQWLQTRNLASAAPVVDTFPDFDDNLRQAFQQEIELFFESVVQEDRSVADLLDADYTFVNERLARHYGISGVYGPRFRRVPLEGDLEVRRGLLGKGAVLTVTSLADRTSPVQRGKWILMNVLGTIPPEPPPNVPALDDSAPGNDNPTLRARMEQHRTNPFCAACHRIMDPFGFVLENFDAVGQWRDQQAGQTINTVDMITDGSVVDGPSGLRGALGRYTPQFVRTVTEKLMTYALGRGVEYYDMPVVRSIVRQAEANDYRFSDIIMGIVNSDPFLMNMEAQPLEVAASR